VIAAVRAHSLDLPLFIHVFGAMLLFGAALAAAGLAVAGWRRPQVPALAASAFWSLLAVAVPSWVVMYIGAMWIHSKEFKGGASDPTWISVGFAVAEPGLLILLAATGVAFWWMRSGKAIAGRIVAGLSCVYLVLLAVAWLAMSGKWS
jgi:hypothetical protein